MSLWRPVQDQAAMEAETAALIARGFKRPNWHEAWAEGTKFIDRSPIHRFQGCYIEGLVTDFEQRFLDHFRQWLFGTFLADVPVLYEFGAGSAHNLAAYRRQFPEKDVVALDYAVGAMMLARGQGIRANVFDFFKPPSALDLPAGAGALTFCALEQVGPHFAPFLSYMLRQKIKRVVHVEPIVELYDSASTFDGLAIDYHRARAYLTGFLPCLRDLEREGEIRIVYQRRMGFGSRFHEGYSVIVWEPT